MRLREEILFERQSRTDFKMPIWKVSLFPLGSFAYFCCQKYKNEAWNQKGINPCEKTKNHTILSYE